MANVSDRNSTDINVNVNDFVKIVDDVATPLFRKDNKQPVDNKYTHFTKHDWYNNNCKEKNRVFNHALNDFRENCSNENRYILVNARSEYKSTLRTCKYEYDTQRS